MKRITAAVVAVFAAIGMMSIAHATCHDTYDCEDVATSVAGHYRWAPGATTVWYYINPYHDQGSDDPVMTADIKSAANVWSNISFNGSTINFRYRFKEVTNTYEPDTRDNKNVVGWG